MVWHLDCGLLISLPDFRRELRELGVRAAPPRFVWPRSTHSWASPTAGAHVRSASGVLQPRLRVRLGARFIAPPPAPAPPARALALELVGHRTRGVLPPPPRARCTGTDEMILEMYMLAARPAMTDLHLQILPTLLRERASLRAHQLCPSPKLHQLRVQEWPRVLSDLCPSYAAQPPRPLQFVYDEQCAARCGKRASLLWRPPSPATRARRCDRARQITPPAM